MRRGCLGVGFKAGITLWTSYVNARIFTGICIVILVYLIDACMVLKFSILLNIFFLKIFMDLILKSGKGQDLSLFRNKRLMLDKMTR